MNQVSSKLWIVAFFAVVRSSLGAAPALAAEPARPSGTQAFDQAMQGLLGEYLKIHRSLAADSLSGVQGAAQAVAEKAKKLDAVGVTGEHAQHYKGLADKLVAAAVTLGGQAAQLDAAREAFKELSKPMAMWATMSEPASVSILYCSMAKGSWLQRPGAVRNPYYGSSMLTCGEVVGGVGHAAGGRR